MCVQLRLVSTKNLYPKVKKVFLKLVTIRFMFWKAFDKTEPGKLFIVKSEAFGK